MSIPVHFRLEFDRIGIAYFDGTKRRYTDAAGALDLVARQEEAGLIKPDAASQLRDRIQPNSGGGVSAVIDSVAASSDNGRADALKRASVLQAHASTAGAEARQALETSERALEALTRAVPGASTVTAEADAFTGASNARMAGLLGSLSTGKPTATRVEVKPAKAESAKADAATAVEEKKRSISERIADLKGQASATTWLKAADARIQLHVARINGGQTSDESFHSAFIGGRGVGKSLAAHIYADTLFSRGLTSSSSVQTIDLRRVVEDGQSLAAVLTETPRCGLILLENAEALTKDRVADLAALEVALEHSEPVIVMSGSEDAAETTRSSWRLENIKSEARFDKLKPEMLGDMFVEMAAKKGYDVDETVKLAVIGRLRSSGASSSVAVTELLEDAVKRLASRVFVEGAVAPDFATLRTITVDDVRRQLAVDANGRALALKELDTLVGQPAAKGVLELFCAEIADNNAREARGEKVEPTLANMAFLAPQGTGKTTFARIAQRVLVESGKRNERFEEVTAGDLIEGRVTVHQLYEQARGGVIFVDEWHQLLASEKGRAIIAQFVPYALNHGLETSLFIAGYTGPMEKAFDEDPGFAGRFGDNCCIKLAEQTREELRTIFVQTLQRIGCTASDEVIEVAMRVLDRKRLGANFQNARAAVDLAKAARQAASVRPSIPGQLKELLAVDFGETEIAENNLLAGFDKYVGFEHLKEDLEDTVLLVEDRRRKGLPVAACFEPLSLVIGDKGTGRKSFARELTPVYTALGFIGRPQPETISANSQLGKVVGEAADNVIAMLKRNLGGQIILTDLGAVCATDLVYAKNFLSTLTTELNKPEMKGRVAVTSVMTADERDLMSEVAPDLFSLFTKQFDTNALDAVSAAEVLSRKLAGELTLSKSAKAILPDLLAIATELPNWKNGDDLETLVKALITAQLRERRALGANAPESNELSADALEAGFNKFMSNKAGAAWGSRPVPVASNRLKEIGEKN